MSHTIDPATVAVKEFCENIDTVTLNFHRVKLESRYQAMRTDALQGAFKLSLIVSLTLMIARRIESLVLSFYNVKALAQSPQDELIQIILMLTVGSIEVLFFCFKGVEKLRGIIAMIFIFFTVGFSSLSGPGDIPNLVPLVVPSYIAVFILGAAYTKTWLASASATIIGLVFSIVFNHLYAFPIYELVVFDIFYVASYVMLAMYFYSLEYKDRLSFFIHYIQERFQKGYKRLLTNLPNGVIIFDNEDNPMYYNRIVGQIVNRKTGRTSTRSPLFDDPDQQTTIKENLLTALEDVVQQETGKSLKDVILDPKTGELEDNKKYTYKMEDAELIYNLKWVRITFRAAKCRTIILQDQTAYEKLGKLDEKYQKLYVASIVHDIRTPLNGIVGMLEMLDNSYRTSDEKLYLSVAKRTCKLLLFLTYDITDYSQLEANKFRPNNNNTSVKEILDEVKQLLAFSFERKKLRPYFDANANVPIMVYIDKNRYMQILLNLLGNAIKFTFQGHIKVLVDYDEDNDILITIVRDTGVGIKESELSKLFKLFGKLESNTDINPQGVGFGLAICKKLAESLGGYINVTSKEGMGSTFTFGIKANVSSLKVCNRAYPSYEVEPMSADTPGVNMKIKTHEFMFKSLSKGKTQLEAIPHSKFISARVPIEEHKNEALNESNVQLLLEPTEKKFCSCTKILIVDDNECNLFVIQSYLKMLEMDKADEALNGKEAIDFIMKRAASNKCCPGYKLIIMDINMPIMGGIEAADIINNKIRTREIPSTSLVALSAGQLRADEETTFKTAGFMNYVIKPITKEMFVNVLKQYNIA